MASFIRNRGKEQGIKHHETELLWKENFDKPKHEVS